MKRRQTSCLPSKICFLEDVLNDSLGRNLEERGVGDKAVNVLKHCRIIVTVNGALVHDELAVNILSLNGNAVAVKLDRLALCAEGDEHRQGAEVVDMMIDRSDAE